MTSSTHTDPSRRHDFVLLFDVADGNPNGDPDAGNLPRVDPETMQGLVTDVAIKRKVRDWVDTARGTEARFKIYVQHEAFLTDTRARVFSARSGGRSNVPVNEGRQWMCDEFFDVRMFGAVMSMKEHNAGQVRGPIQMTFARSIDPIVPLDLSIVGPAQRQGDVVRPSDGDEAPTTYGTMGRKALVPYGVYRSRGFFNPHFAKQTGADSEDLDLFWQALQQMWELDRSSSRGMMACRGLYVFTHESPLGNARARPLRAGQGGEKERCGGSPFFLRLHRPGGRSGPARWRHAVAACGVMERERNALGEGLLDGEEIEVPISALEHYSYCPRQCGLIHIEQTFEENIFTVKGRLAHERVDAADREIARGVRVLRGVPLWSERYRLRGKADVVEMRPEGPYPVEYKLGHRRGRHPDLQLCAQALCLEEMLGVPVPKGAIFYHAARRRHVVTIDRTLRDNTVSAITSIRRMLRTQHLPPAPNDARCPSCSLINACLPYVVAEPARLRGLQGALFVPYDMEADGA